MLGYNRTITCTNIGVLLNIGPGAGGEREKSSSLPNTFDDDCTTYMMYTVRVVNYFNLLIFFDNLVQSQQSPHPCCSTVLSQVSIHLVNNSWPFVRKVMAKNLAHTYSQL